MDNTNWYRQKADKPLFSDIWWSRPENRRHAGKLLIVGGNKHSFNAVSGAYSASVKAGIGTSRVILPDSLRKILERNFPEAEFAPSTPSGSFARSALAQFLDGANWADGVLLAGDFGKNSETSILLEGFIQKYNGRLTLTQDGVDDFLKDPRILKRPETTLCLDVAQLQKLAAQEAMVMKQSVELAQLVALLSNWTGKIKSSILIQHHDQILCAYQAKVSSTPGITTDANLSACASVWQIQQPTRTFEAITSAVYASLNDR